MWRNFAGTRYDVCIGWRHHDPLYKRRGDNPAIATRFATSADRARICQDIDVFLVDIFTISSRRNIRDALPWLPCMCTVADVGECLSAPCQHGGTCVRRDSVFDPMTAGYDCVCDAQYTGLHCEHKGFANFASAACSVQHINHYEKRHALWG